MEEGAGGTLSRDVLERISYVLGIYKALQILFPDPARADAWVKRPNAAPLFAGQRALDRLLSGNVSDLFVVRQYLDAQRGAVMRRGAARRRERDRLAGVPDRAQPVSAGRRLGPDRGAG